MSKKEEKKVLVTIPINQNTNNENSDILIIKLLIVGDPGVGKSNFIYRYTKDQFSDNTLSSVGFESNSKEIDITDKKVIVQLWDSAGEDKFKSITKNLFSRVQGIIIVYDITNKQSFLNVPNWIKLINEDNNNIPYVLAGNKCDLQKERVIQEEEGKKFSHDNNIDFLETSAKEDINIMECINNFVKKIVNSENFVRNVSFSLQDQSFERNSINKTEKCC